MNHYPTGQVSRGSVIAGLILLGILGLLIIGAHAAIMRPVIRSWGVWSCIDGVELLLHWLCLFWLVGQFGFFYGTLAIGSLLAGTGTACLQAVLLRNHGLSAYRWIVGSMLAWVCAGWVSTWVEIRLHDPVLSVVYGVAVGRLIYGMLSSPLLGWVVTPTDVHIPQPT